MGGVERAVLQLGDEAGLLGELDRGAFLRPAVVASIVTVPLERGRLCALTLNGWDRRERVVG